MTALLVLTPPPVELAMQVFTLMAPAHARNASTTAKFAVMEPAVLHVKLVMKTTLESVTAVRLALD